MKEILRYFWRRKLRTALTIFAVTVGIFAVTTVGSIAEQLETTIAATEQDALMEINVHTQNYQEPLSEGTVRHLRRIQGVAGVKEALMGNLEQPEDAPVTISINPEMFWAVRSDIAALEYEPPLPGLGLAAGRLPESRNETVVTWAMAQAKGLTVGETLVIRERPFEVVGIWEDAGTVDARMAQIDYVVAEDLLGENRFFRTVSVVPATGSDPEALADRIEEALPEVVADSPTEAVAQSRQQVLIFSLIVGASGIISLLIGTFTIVNTMVVSVQERRAEIGLKKALGAADSHILSEVITEAILIALLGGVLGVAGGALVGSVGNALIKQQIGSPLFLLTPRLGIGVIAFSVVMGVIAGAYPAWRAARLDPIVALRGGGSESYAGRGLRRLLTLLRRNARSILTLGGIAIGIFALVLLGSLSEALNSYLNNVTAGTRNLFMIMPERADVPVGRSMARVLRSYEGVQDVILTNSVEMPLSFAGPDDDEARKSTIWAHESWHGDWGFAMPVRNRLAQGRFFASTSVDEVVLGAGLAEVQGSEVGDLIWIDEHPFTVVGLWEKIPFDVGGNDQAAYISLEALARLQGGSGVGGVAVRAESGQSERLQSQIEAEFTGVELMATDEIFGQIQQVFGILIAVMGGIFSIAVFVGAVSVVNTMVIAVNEQVPEIGLKKAVGAEDGDILAEVLLQAAKLGGLGGFVGILLAWVGTLIINPLVKESAQIDILHLSPRLAVAALLFSVVLGMIAGFVPARKAARLDPVVALHAD